MHYEFTEDAIEFDGMQAFRIRALIDMPEFDINAGELGGYVTKDSMIARNSWVDGDATVWKSTLEDNAIVEDDAFIRESTLRRRCRIGKNARIVSSDVGGVHATGNSRVLRSTLVSKVPRFIAFMLEDKAEMTGCNMTYVSPRGKRIRLNGETKLIQCTLQGKGIEFDGETHIKHSHIDGESFYFDDVSFGHQFKLSGKQASFKDVKQLVKVTMGNVTNMELNGKMTIHFTTIVGDSIKFDGENISIAYSSINGNRIRIQDAVRLKEVNIDGNDVELSDLVSVQGKQKDRVCIGDEVQILDMVTIETAGKKKSMKFVQQKLSGDMRLTGI